MHKQKKTSSEPIVHEYPPTVAYTMVTLFCVSSLSVLSTAFSVFLGTALILQQEPTCHFSLGNHSPVTAIVGRVLVKRDIDAVQLVVEDEAMPGAPVIAARRSGCSTKIRKLLY